MHARWAFSDYRWLVTMLSSPPLRAGDVIMPVKRREYYRTYAKDFATLSVPKLHALHAAIANQAGLRLPTLTEFTGQPVSEEARAFADAWHDELLPHGAREYFRNQDIRRAASFAVTHTSSEAIRRIFGEGCNVPSVVQALKGDYRVLLEYEDAVETILATWAADESVRLAAKHEADFRMHLAHHVADPLAENDPDPSEGDDTGEDA